MMEHGSALASGIESRRWLADGKSMRNSLVLLAGLALTSLGCASRTSSVPAIPAPPPSAPSTPSSEGRPAESKPEPKGAEGKSPGGPAGVEASSGGEARSETTGQDEQDGEAGAGESESAEAAPSGVRTAEEEQDALDRKLHESLQDFDELLIKEQELLEERREAAGIDPSGGGGETGEPSGGLAGVEGGQGSEAGEPAQAGAERDAATGGSPDSPQGEPVESAGDRSVEGGEGDTTNGRVPPDVGDGSDDDIVARQLREAAMNEDDPELREKLWDEYRAYKNGTSGKSKE